MRIPFVTENTVDLASDINDSLLVADGLIPSRVADMVQHPVGTHPDGQRLAVLAGASGVFAGQDGKLAVYSETGDFWNFFAPVLCVYQNAIWISTGTDWVAA